MAGRHEFSSQTKIVVLGPAQTRVKSISQMLGDLKAICKARWGQTLLSSWLSGQHTPAVSASGPWR